MRTLNYAKSYKWFSELLSLTVSKAVVSMHSAKQWTILIQKLCKWVYTRNTFDCRHILHYCIHAAYMQAVLPLIYNSLKYKHVYNWFGMLPFFLHFHINNKIHEKFMPWKHNFLIGFTWFSTLVSWNIKIESNHKNNHHSVECSVIASGNVIKM